MTFSDWIQPYQGEETLRFDSTVADDILAKLKTLRVSQGNSWIQFNVNAVARFEGCSIAFYLVALVWSCLRSDSELLQMRAACMAPKL